MKRCMLLCLMVALFFSGCSFAEIGVDLHPETKGPSLEERYAARFEETANTYIEEHLADVPVTREEPMITPMEYHYAFSYRLDDLSVKITLTARYDEEQVCVEVRCAPDKEPYQHIAAVQERFTNYHTTEERLRAAFLEVKTAEKNGDNARRELDYWGNFYIVYDASPVPERWAVGDANGVSYAFYGNRIITSLKLTKPGVHYRPSRIYDPQEVTS